MGDEIKYYCLKCGEGLNDRPTGQCPSCKCPYDLDNNLTYSLLPRPPFIEAVAVTFIWTVLLSYFYILTVLSLAMVLPLNIGAPLALIGIAILAIFAWLVTLKLTRLASLIALTSGFTWGPILAALTLSALRDDFIRSMRILDWIYGGTLLWIILTVLLYLCWAIHQLQVRHWRAKHMNDYASDKL